MTDAGQVYSFGYGVDGCLGHSNARNQRTPKRIEALQGVSRVVSVAAGANHSLAVLDSGNICSWGNDGDGRLGLGLGHGGSMVPQQIPGLQA